MAGRDASSAFEDVGHSEEAKELVKKYTIGTLNNNPVEEENPEDIEKVTTKTEEEIEKEQETAPVEEITNVLHTGDDSIEKNDVVDSFAEAQVAGIMDAIDEQLEAAAPKEPEVEESEPVEVKKVDKTTVYSAEELAKHTSPDDCWIAVNGKVVDVTSYLDSHPGGDDVLLEVAGTDATDDFEDIGHSDDAIEAMEEFVIGVLESEPAAPVVEPEPVVEDEPVVLPPVEEPVIVVEPVEEEEPVVEEKVEQPESQSRGIVVTEEPGELIPTVTVNKPKEEVKVIKATSADKERDEKVRSDKQKIKKEAAGIPWGLVATSVIAVGIIGGFIYFRKKQ